MFDLDHRKPGYENSAYAIFPHPGWRGTGVKHQVCVLCVCVCGGGMPLICALLTLYRLGPHAVNRVCL